MTLCTLAERKSRDATPGSDQPFLLPASHRVENAADISSSIGFLSHSSKMSTALSRIALLKAEVRLAQALSEFCGSLSEPRAREFKTLQTTSPPGPDDVIRLTEEINRDGSRAHRSWRPYATKMALFLEKVQSLARVGDFLVGSSQNLVASGVWATIKLTLGVGWLFLPSDWCADIPGFINAG